MILLKQSLLALTLCASLACRLVAQAPAEIPADPGLGPQKNAKNSAKAVAKGQEESGAAGLQDRRFQISFEHATSLSDAASALRDIMPDLNIVVPPSLSQVSFGPLKLRNVTLGGLIRGISTATDGKIEAIYDGEEYLTFEANAAAAPEQQPICQILSLRRYLEGKNEEEATKAIEDLKQVVRVASDHLEHARGGIAVKSPDFSVHPSTKLLIVVGPPESVGIVEKVVSAVTEPEGNATPEGLPGGPFGGGGFPGRQPTPGQPVPGPFGNPNGGPTGARR